ncbi:glycosyltransferase family 2 protein [Costertonia aggregata]|uniref:Glycosyltransferase family 2 protein n=1 Tax=Costertonia aggregata TaxID=343403 RepID=A0A7H9AP82_9FLAO|nr:glycosyltransferase family 2 protein [Costertonia aggregata]QLG45240.1 glycosyltransferase family 2 protein [Costertonia aggregata]
MKFSLILATFGIKKIRYIKELLQSLNDSTFNEFEVILVDQNPENDIELLFFEERYSFSKQYLKSEPGLSKARNIGLAVAKGSYIAFPDDDCIYPRDLLSQVYGFLQDNPSIDLLAIDTRDTITGNKLPYTKRAVGQFKMKKNDIFKTVTSISIFAKKYNSFFFDERLGLGAEYPSCEEFDFVTTYFKNLKNCYFTDEFFVLHPNHTDKGTSTLVNKIRRHGVGHGAYFKKHFFFVLSASLYQMVVVPIGGIIFGIFSLNKNRISIYWAYLVSRAQGFISF